MTLANFLKSRFFLKNAIKLATYFRKLRYEIETTEPERSAKKYLEKLLKAEVLSEHKRNYAGFLKEIEKAINEKQITRIPFYAEIAMEDENVTPGDLGAIMTAWNTFAKTNPDLELSTVAECSKSASQVWTSRTKKDAYQAKQEYLLSRYATKDDAQNIEVVNEER